MSDHASRAARFAELHHGDGPLLLPNPWDVGSARLFASLGLRALATTSSGHAATLGRLDGGVSRDEALAHAATIVNATELPVNADLENAFSDDPAGVAETIRLAATIGLAGCSVEDFTGREDDPIYPVALAVDRFVSYSPPAQRTSSTGAPILTTRSPASGRSRRQEPTSCTPPA